MVQGDYQSEVRLRFESEDKARVLMDCLGVDEELQPTKISRTFDVETSAEGAVLVVKFVSTESRVLRVAMSSFLDMAIVSCKTMLEFA
jgi:tRNA threonylcarbamoyladenosine modification (KEOPS) complex  Pcc1 subunit